MIILTPEQAKAITAESAAEHRLEPVPTADGNYFLPEEVLSDPAHKQHLSLLQSCEHRALRAEEQLPLMNDGEDWKDYIDRHPDLPATVKEYGKHGRRDDRHKYLTGDNEVV